MSRVICCLWGVAITAIAAGEELPTGVDPSDRLLELGCLDVTKAPYLADPTGTADSTKAIQRAVNDARDHGLVCFLPEGTYLISDTISCEQQVRKLDRPRYTDARSQHYWDVDHRIVIFGSGKGKRPLIKLSDSAKGFDDPNNPKFAIWIWAQTRDDAPGKEKPIWGKEQPNIAFRHFFKGIENTSVKGAKSVASDGVRLPSADGWTLIRQYSSTTPQGVNVINGVLSTDEISSWEAVSSAPAFETLRERHYRQVPCVDEEGVVNVKDFGATGDGQTDDSEAFRNAIATGDKVFVPKGNFRLSGTLELRPNTHFFGLTRSFSSMGGAGYGRGGRGRGGSRPGLGGRRGGANQPAGGSGSLAGPSAGESSSIVTVDDLDAAPGFSHVGVRGNIVWRSGNGTSMLAAGLPRTFSGSGGGRFYGVMNMGRQLVLHGVTNPLSLYSFNVERVTANPQFVIRDCRNVRIFYFKVEAGTLGGRDRGDGNTPGAIVDSENVHVYCMYGNVRNLGNLPMLDVVNSDEVVVSQLKAFQPSTFPHLVETRGDQTSTIPSSRICALFARESKGTSND